MGSLEVLPSAPRWWAPIQSDLCLHTHKRPHCFLSHVAELQKRRAQASKQPSLDLAALEGRTGWALQSD